MGTKFIYPTKQRGMGPKMQKDLGIGHETTDVSGRWFASRWAHTCGGNCKTGKVSQLYQTILGTLAMLESANREPDRHPSNVRWVAT